MRKFISKDLRFKKSERKIENALFKLWQQHLCNIKIKDICKEGNIKPPTFYNHYYNINDAIQKIESNLIEQFTQNIQNLALDQVQLNKIFRALFLFILKNRKYFSAANQQLNFKVLYQIISTINSRFILTNSYSKNTNHQFYSSLTGALIFIIYDWCEKTDFDFNQIPKYISYLEKTINSFYKNH